jgi:hypothetical protein
MRGIYYDIWTINDDTDEHDDECDNVAAIVLQAKQ